ncbi:MAG: DUF2461 domain-containing protein [Bacteroidales bacterium]|nr:DUF2461 domain-containing protein [Bacteroidales bacterium]
MKLNSDTLPFFDELVRNNNKSWFEANRARWDAIRKDFVAFTAALLDKMVELDHSLAGAVASQCVYRINRDIRFSQDKTPYKDHISFFLPSGGMKRCGVAGYYLGIRRNDCNLGGGIFMPEPRDLQAIRQEIFYNHEEFLHILNDKTYRRWYNGTLWDYGKLKTAPKGYPKDWEHIDLLRYKHYVSMHVFDDSLATSPDLFDYVFEAFRASVPLNRFVLQAMDNPQ